MNFLSNKWQIFFKVDWCLVSPCLGSTRTGRRNGGYWVSLWQLDLLLLLKIKANQFHLGGMLTGTQEEYVSFPILPLCFGSDLFLFFLDPCFIHRHPFVLLAHDKGSIGPGFWLTLGLNKHPSVCFHTSSLFELHLFLLHYFDILFICLDNYGGNNSSKK